MTKLDPEQTPDQYDSIECIGEYPDNVKLFRNTNAAGEVFFHVAREPQGEKISSKDDIKTIAAFQVAPSESEEEVRKEAEKDAKTRRWF